MSYVIDEPNKHWLLVDENGRIIAICANEWIANLAAKPLDARIEQVRKGDWMVGDRLGVFHG